jgi:hypothetical protein
MKASSQQPEFLPHVTATLKYLAPMRETLFNYTYGPPPGMPRTNAVYDERAMPIYAARDLAPAATLDREGFTLVPDRTSVADFDDEDELRRVYYAETQSLVKRVTGCARVEIFDYTIRRRPKAPRDDRVVSIQREPVMRVHNDYTVKSGPQRVRDLCGAEADDLLTRRFAFINVWRPIRGPLLDAPLAVCDARSVAFTDFVASEQRYEDRTGEIYVVTYNPAHRWFYMPAMKTDEALLLKCYDSVTDIARFAPHSAFTDPTTPADALPRESIEIRTIAFFA